MNEKIRALKAQIKIEEEKVRSCHHSWGASYGNPEIVSESYGSHMVTQGNHVWYEPDGYHDVSKPRWTRKCTLCGFEEHTYKQKPVITKYEPDF